MAKFTKLNIGEAVASSGGRGWKKLSSVFQLTAPTLSLDGDMLTITDNSGLATAFDVLVDGSVKYTYAKYLYNGVLLPPIPIMEDYPYCWIRKHTTNDQYQLVFAPSPWYYKDNAVYCSDSSASEPWYNITISTANNATGWTFNKMTTGHFVVDDARPVFWSNHDIPNGSATATDIYFKATEPVPSNVGLTSATLNLSTLNLPEGTHSITAISKADGYPNSAESEAVSYEADELAGTWVMNSVINEPTSTESTDFVVAGSYYQAIDSSNLYVETPLTQIWLRNNTINSYNAEFYLRSSETFLATSGYYSPSKEYVRSAWSSGSNYNEVSVNSNSGILYRTFTITSKLSEVSNGDVLLSWLQANATKII